MEIKLRAWDIESQEMLPCITPLELLKKGLLQDNLFFMLYTGIKDKNGIEIYEYDILKYEFNDIDNLGNVIIDVSYWIVMWDKEECEFVLCNNLTQPQLDKSYVEHSVLSIFSTDVSISSVKEQFSSLSVRNDEVVGNVFENIEPISQ